MAQPLESSRPEVSINVAVCQLPADLETASDAWGRLCEATSRLTPDLWVRGTPQNALKVLAAAKCFGAPLFDLRLCRRV